MLRTSLPLLMILILTQLLSAQNFSYKDSVANYLNRYVKEHEVVKGKDRNYIQFYPIDETYKVTARWEHRPNSPWFLMETSGIQKKNYRVAGVIYFSIKDTALSLHVYQSQALMNSEKYKDYLFIPFLDATNGTETYLVGRYLDLSREEIKGDSVIIDFNKAYNPYCAYISNQYNCPIPPRENLLPVAIRAGEKQFAKPH